MAKPKFQIRLPEPCLQDLNTMSVQGNGRFCDSCQKCVIDFTHKTDKEIIGVFQENKGQVCGTFRPDQLNRLLLPAGNLPASRWKAIALAITAYFSARSESEANPGLNLRPLFHKTSQEPHTESDPGKRVKITGHIRDKVTGNSIPNVIITKDSGLSIVGSTNERGYFRFSLAAEEFLQGTVAIRFSHDAYILTEINLASENTVENQAKGFVPAISEINLELDRSSRNVREVQISSYPTTSGVATFDDYHQLKISASAPLKLEYYKFTPAPDQKKEKIKKK
jgi:hypothetical protein